MTARIRNKLTYSNVIASLALFVALGGAAVAAGLPKNSVGPKQLKRNAVTAVKLHKGAVNSSKIARGAVTGGKLAASSVSSGILQNGSVIAAKLAKNSVTNAAISNGVVGTSKLGNGVVTTAKLADKSVTSAKLGDEVGPLLGTLKSGQTLRGVFDLGGEDLFARTGVTLQFPLLNAPAAPETNVVAADKPTTACPGITGGNAATPQAAAGQLCVYVTSTSAKFKSLAFDAGSVSRLGFGLKAEFEEPGDRFVQGQWAVTAP
jgi:hypothetical protein